MFVMILHITVVSLLIVKAAMAHAGQGLCACEALSGYVISAGQPPKAGIIPIDIPAIPTWKIPHWVKRSSPDGDPSVNISSANATFDIPTANGQYNNEISGGQTNWHSATIGTARSFNVDLKWSDPDGKLRLVVYTPDNKVLGPYYDTSYGDKDGEICLNIANPSGVAEGKWYFKVTDMSKTGKVDYYFKTY
jgi:hypothetical protein